MKVIIAEDEYYSRKVLMKLVKEMGPELEICLEAETGRQAADYLKEQPADLVITDIRMPEMDGLALAGFIWENCPGTDVIIESGYADFNYAREALRYGVKSYLTKPVKPEELKNTVSEIMKQRHIRNTELERQTEERAIKKSFRYLSLEKIVAGQDMAEQLKTYCGGCFDEYSYRLFLIQPRVKQEEAAALKMAERIKTCLSENQLYDFYFPEQDELIFILFGEEAFLKKERLMSKLRHLAEKESFCCGCSRIYEGFSGLMEAYRDSIYAINNRLLTHGNQVFIYQESIKPENMFSPQDEILLYETILKCNYESAGDMIKRFLAGFSHKSLDIYSLYSGIMQIFSVMNRANSHRDHSGGEEGSGRYFMFTFKSDLYQFRTLENLSDYLLHILHNICGRDREKEASPIIEELKEYVARSYRYDISLKELAAHRYFMNPSYLSRLFKAETGMNFTKYLSAYRLERAKELLQNTDFLITEVADLAGFNDTSYFIHTFRKSCGMTPEQYRSSGCRGL